MKYTHKRKDTAGTEIFSFDMGQHEIIILRDMLLHYRKTIPHSFFNHGMISRGNAMLDEFNKIVLQMGLGKYKKVKGGWSPGSDKEKQEEVL